MTDARAKVEHHRTVFDRWRSIGVALYMSLVGYGVLVGIPVISTAWVELLGFTEVQVGRVAGADLGGLSFGALLASMLVHRVNRRLLVVLSVALAVLSNGLCMVYTAYEQVLPLRIAAGLGSGVYTSVAVANLGATARPARAFNMMLFAFAFSQGLEMHLLPRLPMIGIYGFFIGCYLLTLLALHWIPPRPVEPSLDIEVDVEDEGGGHHVEHKHVPSYVPWLVLCAMIATYINIGAFWTYVELATLDAGVADEWISPILTWSSLCSVLGCLIATVLSDRFGLARPLFGALLAMATITGMLAGGIGYINIMISVFSFNLLWVFIDVYQMASVANVDHEGRYAALMPGAQGLGQIIGPNLAASLLGWGLGYDAVFVMCASAALTGLSIYAVMYLYLRRTIPALADAS